MLRQIAGLERPSAGTIRFGADTWFDSAAGIWQPPQQRGIGLVFQEPTLFPHLSVEENIRYGIRHVSDRGRTGAGPVAEIAAMLGFDQVEQR